MHYGDYSYLEFMADKELCERRSFLEGCVQEGFSFMHGDNIVQYNEETLSNFSYEISLIDKIRYQKKIFTS